MLGGIDACHKSQVLTSTSIGTFSKISFILFTILFSHALRTHDCADHSPHIKSLD